MLQEVGRHPLCTQLQADRAAHISAGLAGLFEGKAGHEKAARGGYRVSVLSCKRWKPELADWHGPYSAVLGACILPGSEHRTHLYVLDFVQAGSAGSLWRAKISGAAVHVFEPPCTGLRPSSHKWIHWHRSQVHLCEPDMSAYPRHPQKETYLAMLSTYLQCLKKTHKALVTACQSKNVQPPRPLCACANFVGKCRPASAYDAACTDLMGCARSCHVLSTRASSSRML